MSKLLSFLNGFDSKQDKTRYSMDIISCHLMSLKIQNYVSICGRRSLSYFPKQQTEPSWSSKIRLNFYKLSSVIVSGGICMHCY